MTANHDDHPHANLRPTPSASTGALDCLPASAALSPGQAGSGQSVTPVDGSITSSYGPRLGLTGHVIVIDHGGGLQTSYNHMYAGGVGVRVGQRVGAGQVIAAVGNDGNSTGCHLHFRVYDRGRHTAPETFMATWGWTWGERRLCA
ncbi:M23 family metallopeptidase [Georgenia sp. Z1344]|uniref:M23 family metallopeptidase n=1 Tax=Georgenia sp. Z1344 TaxID=3416706 RepID=UPI003CFA8B6A